MNSQERIEKWLKGPIDEQTKQAIYTLQKQDPKALEEAFGSKLKFGTGGMRSTLGIGSARMNRYTVQMATQGLANYLLESPSPKRVFISHDNRHFSKEFALDAARVLAANGIEAFLTKELRPTPFVSFGVRKMNCGLGIMITASHNPKEYNGYKVYGPDGGQIVPPIEPLVTAQIQKIDLPGQVKITESNSPLIHLVDEDLDQIYLQTIEKEQLRKSENQKMGSELSIVYTPLHGCGLTLVPKALKMWGFSNLHLVKAQTTFDPDFSTVVSPNPEDIETLSMGIDQMKQSNADLLIATDPDSDRMATVAHHKGQFIPINGNQAACLLLEYLCQTHNENKTLSKKAAAVTTIVSTALLTKIADTYNVSLFRTLTGFKYIAQKIALWESNHAHDFLFGAEESYGYLVGTEVRDKDAVVISCLFCEMALWARSKGKTLIDFLEEIYRKYGFFCEAQKVIKFPPGAKGMEQMAQIMDRLRSNPPKEIEGHQVIEIKDYQNGLDDLPPSNVLSYLLEDHNQLIVRPSGTEPKLKIYGGIYFPKFETLEQSGQKGKDKLQRLFSALPI